MHIGKFARAEAAEHEEWYHFSTWCTHHLPPASVVSYIYIALLSWAPSSGKCTRLTPIHCSGNLGTSLSFKERNIDSLHASGLCPTCSGEKLAENAFICWSMVVHSTFISLRESFPELLRGGNCSRGCY